MRIVGFDTTIEMDTKVAKVDAWYDRSLRLWTCLWLNATDDQLGCAQYANNKAEMKELVALMKVSEPTDCQI